MHTTEASATARKPLAAVHDVLLYVANAAEWPSGRAFRLAPDTAAGVSQAGTGARRALRMGAAAGGAETTGAGVEEGTGSSGGGSSGDPAEVRGGGPSPPFRNRLALPCGTGPGRRGRRSRVGALGGVAAARSARRPRRWRLRAAVEPPPVVVLSGGLPGGGRRGGGPTPSRPLRRRSRRRRPLVGTADNLLMGQSVRGGLPRAPRRGRGDLP